MRIAVVGTGISGNVTSWLLARHHELTVFEQNDYVGGHSHTVRVDGANGPTEVDTGFIVYNDERYPLFSKLLRTLGVESKPTTMSFSVSCAETGLEYSNRSLFAQRRNYVSPRFWRMIVDILRFNESLRRLLRHPEDGLLLGPFLEAERYSRAFVERFLYPLATAIWSADPREMRAFPLRFLAQFFHNHRFLEAFGQPEWRVVRGGSRIYVDKLTAGFKERIRTKAKVQSIRRTPDAVYVKLPGSEPLRFDEVVIATHGDQALAMLADPTPDERDVLGKFAFQENIAMLHTDGRLMPRRKSAWACWNVHVPRGTGGAVAVTYDMDRLQGLGGQQYFVTLNRASEIDPSNHHLPPPRLLARRGPRAESSLGD